MSGALGISVLSDGIVRGTKGLRATVDLLATGIYRLYLDNPLEPNAYAVNVTCCSAPNPGALTSWVQKFTTDQIIVSIRLDNLSSNVDFDVLLQPFRQGDSPMRGCSIQSDALQTVVTGTKGIAANAVRVGTGNVIVTLDTPLAPSEYAAFATMTEAFGSVYVTKLLSGPLAQLQVRTSVSGMPADLDFDVGILPFKQ